MILLAFRSTGKDCGSLHGGRLFLTLVSPCVSLTPLPCMQLLKASVLALKFLISSAKHIFKERGGKNLEENEKGRRRVLALRIQKCITQICKPHQETSLLALCYRDSSDSDFLIQRYPHLRSLYLDVLHKSVSRFEALC